MKKFSRFLLIWIIVSILSGVAGYLWLMNEISPVYFSTTQLYVVPGETSEPSLRASDGGLKEDFAVVFKSNLVISDAQKSVGTSEDLASYISVNTPRNSNVIEIICYDPDQATAKQYVDAVAKSALKTTTIIPVEKISILAEGTSTGVAYKPHLYRYTAYLFLAGAFICFFIELIVALLISAFSKHKEEDDEAEYNRYYGNVVKYDENPKKSDVGKEIKKATKESAASLDDDLLLDDSEVVGVDVFIDTQADEEPDFINEESSSEVIGKIPK
ncbi:YveK family protein [[Clostridium] fimetarium]|uniref:Capsular polysaccharide biosynthesis protein n=1 Tax=[Clostridium] fimetarium TaxID=99656 RepID=A0A1I0LZF6_9FIRM|nr:hypothetical protein [[Clostridium] fimetarium]SEV81370.1 Capsular polysaccharide biosynthesis protein [[Clostridium] fimetarium]